MSSRLSWSSSRPSPAAPRWFPVPLEPPVPQFPQHERGLWAPEGVLGVPRSSSTRWDGGLAAPRAPGCSGPALAAGHGSSSRSTLLLLHHSSLRNHIREIRAGSSSNPCNQQLPLPQERGVKCRWIITSPCGAGVPRKDSHWELYSMKGIPKPTEKPQIKKKNYFI